MAARWRCCLCAVSCAGAVLTLPPARAAELLAMDEDDFSAAVSECFEYRLGTMRQHGGRHAYPLVGVYAERFCAPGAALIGDAAVGMHPVTAHGFNFGLQGQARLAGGILEAVSAGARFRCGLRAGRLRSRTPQGDTATLRSDQRNR